MYTVLLVDDEQTILTTLLTSIPWQQFGVDRVLTAPDGASALEQLMNTPVDLLITDIRMPRMDGLELLTHVRQKLPSIHCILLTAYGEFEYARKAIALGVENYLLKPFRQEELEETIEKALDNIYRSQDNNQDLFRNNILLRWAYGTITNDELSERAPLLNLNPYLPSYRAVCLRRLVPSCSLSAFYRRCRQMDGFPSDNWYFWANRDQMVLILSDSLTEFKLAELFSSAQQALSCSGQLLIAVGPSVNSSEKLPRSYQEACRLFRFSETANSSLQTDETILYRSSASGSDPDFLVHKLIVAFQSEEEAMRREQFQSVFTTLRSYANQEPDCFSLLCQNLIRLFQQELPDHPELLTQLERRFQAVSSESVRTDFTEPALELLEYSYLQFRYYFEKFSPIIQLAVSYIHEHFEESLSIKEFCVKNKMNTAYFGYLFKKDTGMFFNNYLTGYRICCSLPLLLTTSKTIQDIAKATGFSSTTYYISCFKKQTGLSPVKYRELKTLQ